MMAMCPFSNSSHNPEAFADLSSLKCPFSGSTAPPCVLQAQHTLAQPPTDTDAAPTNSTSSEAACSTSSSAASDSVDSAASGSSVFQAWQVKRPNLQHDPKLTRRQLRQLGRTWSLADVAQHRYCDDGWIAVDGRVYDITEHVALHPGWDSGCRVTEVLSILAHLGCDCSEEFHEIHRSYPVAYKQLAAYYIGDLAP